MKSVIMILMTITLSLIMLACDPPSYYDYYVTNNCDDYIIVKVTGSVYNRGHNNMRITQIEHDSTKLVFSSEDYQFIHIQNAILVLLEEVTIIKGNETSRVDYINTNLWTLEKIDKDHGKCYITINPKDFEDE